MNPATGELRALDLFEKPKPNEVEVNTPNPDCGRCNGRGSIPIAEGTRPERRRATKNGLPIWAKFLPCPECNPYVT